MIRYDPIAAAIAGAWHRTYAAEALIGGRDTLLEYTVD